jgi:tRNA1(Val) A37 N6-methylase TrmN6
MREILRSNDAVLLSFAQSVLRQTGIDSLIADQHISVLEGSIGAFPRRLLVGDEDWHAAHRALTGADLGAWLIGGDAVPASGAPPKTEPETADAFLGGALDILQPSRGYRAGIDAVLLAAAVPASAGGGQRVLDAGAGVGVAGLAVARRIPDAQVILVERDVELARLGRSNIERNGLSDRVRLVEADLELALGGQPALAELSGKLDHALANPPFHSEDRGTPAPDPAKAASNAMAETGLPRWLRFLSAMVRPGGSVTLIHKAEALPALLAACEGRFGALVVLPIHARAEAPAIRVIVRGIKGSRGPLRLNPQLTLHGEGHAFRPEVELVLRGGAALPL